jgi:hypothetical protein
MKKIFLTLMSIISINIYSTPVTHTVTYNVTTSVTCSVGDTLKLYGTFAGDYVASTYSGTNTISNIFPTMVSTTPFYIGYFVIVGSETSFVFAEITHGQKTGTINVASTTGILDDNSYTLSKVFPNPFKDKIILSASKATKMDVLSSSGCLIFSLVIPNGETEIDLTKYPSGLYFLRYEDNVYKILKE